jgi:hypothetical protein
LLSPIAGHAKGGGAVIVLTVRASRGTVAPSVKTGEEQVEEKGSRESPFKNRNATPQEVLNNVLVTPSF